MTTAIDGTAIRCTCCEHRKKLAEIHPREGLEIISRYGGKERKHRTLADPREILEALSGTQGTAVIEWVKGVIR